jgi:nucleolar protein 6
MPILTLVKQLHTMSSTPKLTKKQKKGIAFRESKGARKNGIRTNSSRMENNEVPILEIQENRDAEDVEMESGDVLPEKKGPNAAPVTKDKGKGKVVEQTEESVQASTSKKRKRNSDSGTGKVKRGTKEEGDAPKKKKKGNDEKQRFILFVGKSSPIIYRDLLNF